MEGIYSMMGFFSSKSIDLLLDLWEYIKARRRYLSPVVE